MTPSTQAKLESLMHDLADSATGYLKDYERAYKNLLQFIAENFVEKVETTVDNHTDPQ